MKKQNEGFDTLLVSIANDLAFSLLVLLSIHVPKNSKCSIAVSEKAIILKIFEVGKKNCKYQPTPVLLRTAPKQYSSCNFLKISVGRVVF